MEENVRRGVCRSDGPTCRDSGRFAPTIPEADRFWLKVVQAPSGCWLWTGGTTAEGYGRFHLPAGEVRAHRYAYELLVAPIDDGDTLDHLLELGCVGPACVRPDHLEPVPNAVNVSRRHRRQALLNGASA